MMDDFGSDVDLKQAESLLNGLDDDKPEDKGKTDESKALEGELITAGELAKTQSRAIVGSLETLFKLKDSKVNYDEDIYLSGEKEISPAIQQYALTNPLRHLVGLNAFMFLGGLVATGIRQIIKNRAKELEESPGGSKPQPQQAES